MTFQHLKHTPLQSAGVIKHTEVPITFTSNALQIEVIFVLQKNITNILLFFGKTKKSQWHYFTTWKM